MKAKASNLVDELGHVDYVFSDKTGTLTQNVMDFRQFTAGDETYGVLYTDPKTKERPEELKNQKPNVHFYDPKDKLQEVLKGDSCAYPEHSKDYLEKMLLAMALNHGIVIDSQSNEYNSASPDELALVNFAK